MLTPKAGAAKALTNRLTRWADAEHFRQHEDKILMVLTLIIGAIVGLVVASFILVTENLGARMYPAGGAAWRRLTVPVLGALLTGVLLYRYFPYARGSGIPQTKTALFLYDGFIRFRTVVGKFVLSSISLASGISLGREGPSVQVGAGIASVLGRWLGLGPHNIRALVPVGAAAALAAAFNTPVAAVLFTLEEVMGDMHAPVLGSVVLSSATSWIVLHLVLGDEPLFHVPAYQLVHPAELIVYAALGVIGGLVSVCFVKLLLWQRKKFLGMPGWTQALQPVAGGLAVGVLGWFVPDVLGVGYSHVSEALNSQLPVRLMVLLVVLKLVATATCYASGNAGGIFGPSLFIGAMMGGAVGATAHSFLPDYTGSAGAYALVGMGAAFAGIIRVPLTSVIMIFEVTRDYSIIVPLMIANLISYFISQRLQPDPIYEALQQQDGIHLPAGHQRESPLLVQNAARRPTQVISIDEPLRQALARVDGGVDAWPVVDHGDLVAMLRIPALREAIESGHSDQTVGGLLEATELPRPLTAENFPHVHRDHSLDMALRRMAQANMNVLPVVSRANVRHFEGIVTTPDILAAYGLAEKPGETAGTIKPERSRGPLLVGLLAAVAGVLIAIGFVSYSYRTQRLEKARREFQAANALLAEDRTEEAIEQLRDALSISHQNGEYRLALGLALVKAQHFSEAEIYLQQILRADPDNGRANLGMARVAAAENRIQDAVKYYHRAIYGSWPHSAEDERTQARFELVEFLVRRGDRKQAVSELSILAEQGPKTPAVKKRVARMLLDLGAARQAAGTFRELTHLDGRDPEASAGLGDAEYALGDCALAQEAYRQALKWDPSNAGASRQRQVCDTILSFDPALPRLSAQERYRRSTLVLDATIAAVERCLRTPAKVVPPELQPLLDRARTALKVRPRHTVLSDITQTNLSLARDLWAQRVRLCNPSEVLDEALDRLLSPAAP